MNSIFNKDARPEERRDRSSELNLAQLRIIFDHLPNILLIQIPTSLVVLFVFWGSLAKEIIFVWLLALWLTSAIRWLIYRHYTNKLQRSEKQAAWFIIIGSAIHGLLWGAFVVLIYLPGDVENAWVILVILTAATAGSAANLPVYLPAFYAFFFCTAIPSLLALLIFWNFTNLALAGGGIVFCIYVFTIARINHRTFIESINLRFDNLELIKALNEKKEEAEHANLAKSKFLAAASHDLRQPFHAIGLFTGALSERIHDSEQADIVSKLKSSVRAMEDLFNALLDISSLDAGVIEKHPVVFPVQTLLDRLELDNILLAKQKSLRFRTARSSLYIHTDPTLLERILRNFISNALQYTVSGGILIGCRRHGQTARICVVDTGPGIPENHQAEIFEEFVQLGNPERDRNKGLGLGLAIVRRLAQHLGHHLIVRSIPGRGSLFAIEVPLGNSAIEFKQSTVSKALYNDPAMGKFIIVIDDDTLVLEALNILLTGWGHVVFTAESGTALRNNMAACTVIPHLIICDYRLPNKENGIEVIELLHNEFNKDIPAILLTGDTAPEILAEAKSHGIRLIHKPLDAQILRELIDST